MTRAENNEKQTPDKELSWGVERRMEFIEFRLFWEGRINRRDLIEQFGVSVPQATVDFKQYQERAPDNLLYD
ncbi:MAG: WYL domain-containing protein, partial [Magnetococcus sp. WYHC-3]